MDDVVHVLDREAGFGAADPDVPAECLKRAEEGVENRLSGDRLQERGRRVFQMETADEVPVTKLDRHDLFLRGPLVVECTASGGALGLRHGRARRPVMYDRIWIDNDRRRRRRRGGRRMTRATTGSGGVTLFCFGRSAGDDR